MKTEINLNHTLVDNIFRILLEKTNIDYSHEIYSMQSRIMQTDFLQRLEKNKLLKAERDKLADFLRIVLKN